MGSYALIDGGVVVNIVSWDGTGDIFNEYKYVEINNAFDAAIGDAYFDDTLYQRPRDGYEYNFDSKSFKWVITELDDAKREAEVSIRNIQASQTEYERASIKIQGIQDSIDDDDFSGSKDGMLTKKNLWVSYRKELRSYITTADGSKNLPNQPTE